MSELWRNSECPFLAHGARVGAGHDFILSCRKNSRHLSDYTNYRISLDHIGHYFFNCLSSSKTLGVGRRRSKKGNVSMGNDPAASPQRAVNSSRQTAFKNTSFAFIAFSAFARDQFHRRHHFIRILNTQSDQGWPPSSPATLRKPTPQRSRPPSRSPRPTAGSKPEARAGRT